MSDDNIANYKAEVAVQNQEKLTITMEDDTDALYKMGFFSPQTSSNFEFPRPGTPMKMAHVQIQSLFEDISTFEKTARIKLKLNSCQMKSKNSNEDLKNSTLSKLACSSTDEPSTAVAKDFVARTETLTDRTRQSSISIRKRKIYRCSTNPSEQVATIPDVVKGGINQEKEVNSGRRSHLTTLEATQAPLIEQDETPLQQPIGVRVKQAPAWLWNSIVERKTIFGVLGEPENNSENLMEECRREILNESEDKGSDVCNRIPTLEGEKVDECEFTTSRPHGSNLSNLFLNSESTQNSSNTSLIPGLEDGSNVIVDENRKDSSVTTESSSNNQMTLNSPLLCRQIFHAESVYSSSSPAPSRNQVTSTMLLYNIASTDNGSPFWGKSTDQVKFKELIGKFPTVVESKLVSSLPKFKTHFSQICFNKVI